MNFHPSRNKFDAKSNRCIFLGYEAHHKALSSLPLPSIPSPPLLEDTPEVLEGDTTSTPLVPMRKGERVRRPPGWLEDYTGSVHTNYITEPNSYKEAAQQQEWIDAMDAELTALENNHTWDIVSLPPGKKAIGNKWVYKVKLTPTGQVERFKARLVAKVYTQSYGTDYDEVFSPVAKLVTVRFLIAVASAHSWFLHQIDVNNAFLHDFLHEEIYMVPPQGYKKCKLGQVCKLVKSLYGLKQASREWNFEFSKKLLSQGMEVA